MPTRLGRYADKVLEIGWLTAAVFTPLYFNVYSSRVFEPDKISTLRSFVLIMLVAWLVKIVEGGVRGYSQSGADTRAGKLSDALGGAAEGGLPKWLGFLRVPMVIPILIYALAYLISSIFTVTPDATIWGSYQRLQGTYSQYSYMLLGIMVIANLRTREQLDRLINFMLLTSIPVAVYGVIQWLKLDPLPWAGDTSSRVASTMGNAIFVAAWLIMVTPLAIYRFFASLTSQLAARREQPGGGAPVDDSRPRSSYPTRRQSFTPSYGWAVVANTVGIILIQLLVFYMALKLMAGLSFPDGRMWPTLPIALIIFFVTSWAIQALGKRRDDPTQTSLFMPIIGVALFIVSVVALPISWAVRQGAQDPTTGKADILTDLKFDPAGLLWVAFFLLFWGALTAGLYTLAGSERITSEEGDEDRGILRMALTVGYALLAGLQVVCIYLTQSRGPWLGLGAGFVTFAVAMWLVGRRHNVRWMTRLGGSVSAIVLALAIFVGALNIPSSPLQALSNLPLIGRGIERLSTMTRTQDGTGKVRELIWQGATALILSDPTRALIGWGPEAMYVAYSPYYPADLAHWELRNATPDRSHNVEFDQLVTLGMVGLMAYYFMVGAFFFYAIRILKRVTSTRDQLLIITFMSAMAAHFVEIQTGIQIAATWTYFYLFIGIVVAFGYYMQTYLRPEAAAVAAEETSNGKVAAGNGVVAAPQVVASTAAPAARKQTVAAGAAGSTASAGPSSTRSGVQPPAKPRAKTTGGGLPGTKPQSAARNPQSRMQSADGRRRQMASPITRPSDSGEWFRNPVMLALYGVALVVALIIVFVVNVATVQADSYYKTGQSYDSQGAQYSSQVQSAANSTDRTNYATTGAEYWSQSIDYYTKAIALQPNQDYYYLFLGRAWLEFAKLVDDESFNVRRAVEDQRNGYSVTDTTKYAYKNQTDRNNEKLYRLEQSQKWLEEAHTLSPLNTDHYANLGRLYLYWADPAGGNNPSYTPQAVAMFEKATQRTPGNAQLWDELAVAYSRDNAFDKAIKTLDYSAQQVDSTYTRTPFLLGQLYQERLGIVRDDLLNNKPLPTDGETDAGKLVLDMGKAYSDTIGLDPGTFLDSTYQSRVDYMLAASDPLTKTNTTLDKNTVTNALTSTITLALQTRSTGDEKQVANYLRQHGAYSGSDDKVPDSVLQSLAQDPNWASAGTQTNPPAWTDSNFSTVAHNASLDYMGLGYVYSKTGAKDRAQQALQRSVLLDPGNVTAQQDLQALKGTKP